MEKDQKDASRQCSGKELSSCGKRTEITRCDDIEKTAEYEYVNKFTDKTHDPVNNISKLFHQFRDNLCVLADNQQSGR